VKQVQNPQKYFIELSAGLVSMRYINLPIFIDLVYFKYLRVAINIKIILHSKKNRYSPKKVII
jgi:hypothetical protein